MPENSLLAKPLFFRLQNSGVGGLLIVFIDKTVDLTALLFTGAAIGFYSSGGEGFPLFDH